MPPLRCQQIAWNNPLYWDNPPTTISDYRQCVIDTFQYWINVHTKPDWWVADQVLSMSSDSEFTAKRLYEDDWKRLFQRDWLNFDFDWKVEIEEVLLSDWLKQGMWQCSACGELFTPIEQEDFKRMECPHTENNKHVKKDMFPSKITDTETRDRIISTISEYIDMGEHATEEQLLRAARKAFYWYFVGGRSRIEPHYRAARERIKLLTNIEGKSREDQLLDIQRATDVRHSNGNMFEDYSNYIGVFWELSDDVRNKGLAEVFGQEAVLQFLEGGE